MIRSHEILRATSWRIPPDSAGLCTDATAPQARNSVFWHHGNYQNRLNFIDNGLLFLFNRSDISHFLVSILVTSDEAGWYTMLLRRRHEILHFDITELLSVSTELSNLFEFFYNDAYPHYNHAIFHISADINAHNDGRGGAAPQARNFVLLNSCYYQATWNFSNFISFLPRGL